jgi:hypothetical protein
MMPNALASLAGNYLPQGKRTLTPQEEGEQLAEQHAQQMGLKRIGPKVMAPKQMPAWAAGIPATAAPMPKPMPAPMPMQQPAMVNPGTAFSYRRQRG